MIEKSKEGGVIVVGEGCVKMIEKSKVKGGVYRYW